MPTPEEIVAAAVANLGVPYELIEIDPAFADTAAFCEKYGYPPSNRATRLSSRRRKSRRNLSRACAVAHRRLDVNKRVTKLMGVPKASFASAEEMMTLTGMAGWRRHPFSLPQGMPLYVDDRVMAPEWIILGGGGAA